MSHVGTTYNKVLKCTTPFRCRYDADLVKVLLGTVDGCQLAATVVGAVTCHVRLSPPRCCGFVHRSVSVTKPDPSKHFICVGHTLVWSLVVVTGSWLTGSGHD